LTTLGIVGCFAGIFIGVFCFNPADMQTGVNGILEVLKGSFLVSGLGIGLSILLKFKQKETDLKNANNNITQDNFIPKLIQIIDKNDQTLQNVSEAITSLKTGLVGNEEGTLLTQIKMMRQDTSDNLSKLNRGFEQFSAHMVENNQKAFIEGLRQAMSDFNTKITEQFGDNFKELNAAVKDLVTWQGQYRISLEKLIEQETQSSKNLTEIVANNQKQYELLEKTNKSHQDAIEKQNEALEEIAEKYDEQLDKFKDFKDVAESLEETIKTSSDQIEILNSQQETMANTLKAMENIVPNANEQISKIIGDLKQGSEMLNKGLMEASAKLNTSLESELNSSLKTLGGHLAQLSTKFVQDYTPLTTKLQDIVNIAQKINK